MANIRWLRLERKVTNSYLTVYLPKAMTFGEAENYIRQTMPTWEVINGSPTDPDANLNEAS
jgi:hypothetical protein